MKRPSLTCLRVTDMLSFPVHFRYVVFHPFLDEILIGKIKGCSPEGVHGNGGPDSRRHLGAQEGGGGGGGVAGAVARPDGLPLASVLGPVVRGGVRYRSRLFPERARIFSPSYVHVVARTSAL